MPWAEFEEKEYEIAADCELQISPSGFGQLFPSGQVLEGVLGYDAAAHPPADHPLWRILDAPRPKGIVLVPNHWTPGNRPPATRLPSQPISLIVQYKRPEYLFGARAKQWSRWREPYFRLTVNKKQQKTLLRLQKSLGSEAVVRYAAPAFWRRGELEAAARRRQILDLTGFVGPEVLAGHKAWTYTNPGSAGFANPSESPEGFERFSDLMRLLGQPRDSTGSSELLASRSLGEHLSRLGHVARERNPTLREALSRWSQELESQDLGISRVQLRNVVDLAAIASLVHRESAVWFITASARPSPQPPPISPVS